MAKIIERVAKIIEIEGVSVNLMENIIGASKGVLGKAIAKNTDISAKWISIVAEKFPQYSTDWLLTGEGEMLRCSVVKHEGTTKELRRNNEQNTKDEPRMNQGTTKGSIPLIPIDAVAGFNGIDMPGTRLEDCQHYYVPEFQQLQAEYMIRVSGSSMYPKYSSGDILACKKLYSPAFIQWGKIYVIDSAQGAMVKRLFPCDENQDSVICKSDNPNYPPFELPKTEIRSLSIVLGSIRFE